MPTRYIDLTVTIYLLTDFLQQMFVKAAKQKCSRTPEEEDVYHELYENDMDICHVV